MVVCWIHSCLMMVALVKSWLYLCRGESAIRQLVESMHRDMGGSHIIQVPPCVNAKIRANGHPHVLMPPYSPVLHHQSCITPAAVTQCLSSCHTCLKKHPAAMSSLTGLQSVFQPMLCARVPNQIRNEIKQLAQQTCGNNW